MEAMYRCICTVYNHTIAGMLVVFKVVADHASAHVASRLVHTDMVTTPIVSEALVNVCKWDTGELTPSMHLMKQCNKNSRCQWQHYYITVVIWNHWTLSVKGKVVTLLHTITIMAVDSEHPAGATGTSIAADGIAARLITPTIADITFVGVWAWARQAKWEIKGWHNPPLHGAL